MEERTQGSEVQTQQGSREESGLPVVINELQDILF